MQDTERALAVIEAGAPAVLVNEDAKSAPAFSEVESIYRRTAEDS